MSNFELKNERTLEMVKGFCKNYRNWELSYHRNSWWARHFGHGFYDVQIKIKTNSLSLLKDLEAFGRLLKMVNEEEKVE